LSDWDEYAKMFAFFYNAQPSTLHGYSPFELVFGKKATELLEVSDKLPLYNPDDYVKSLKHRLDVTNKIVREFMNKNKLKLKTAYDRKSKPQNLKPEDKVVIKNNNQKSKFDTPYLGPFTVVELLEKDNVRLESESGVFKILHKDEIFQIATE
jgi:hypothetical protein